LFSGLKIKGRVVSSAGKPVAYASVYFATGDLAAVADSTGFFNAVYHGGDDSIKMEASAVGYETVQTVVNKKQPIGVFIVLPETQTMLPDVIVTGYELERKGLVMLGEPVVKGKIDSVITKIVSSFGVPSFKTYPNPATKGSSITIDTKRPGRYTIQLITNSGQVLQANEFDAADRATQTHIDLPASIASGIYYIRLVDAKTQKQFTNKIVVM
jgi:hypothetical protein